MKETIGIFILGFIVLGFISSLNAQTPPLTNSKARSEIARGDALLADDPTNTPYAVLAYNEAKRLTAQTHDWGTMLVLSQRYLATKQEWAAWESLSLAFTYSYDMALGDPKKTGIPGDCLSGRRGLNAVINFFNNTLSDMGKSVSTQKRMEFDVRQAENALAELDARYGNNKCPPKPGTRPAVRTTKTRYAPNQNIIVQYTGMPGNNKDVITINNTRTGKMVGWFYTRGKAKGSVRFSKLPAGEYEARARPSAGRTVASSRFTVDAPAPAIRTAKTRYEANQVVIVQYVGLPGASKDLVTIINTRTKKRVGFFYPKGRKTGSVKFSKLPPGEYEARLRPYGGKIEDTYRFTIGTTVETNHYRQYANSVMSGQNRNVLRRDNLSQCQAECDKNGWCKAFEYSTKYKYCHLKDNANGKILRRNESMKFNLYVKQ